MVYSPTLVHSINSAFISISDSECLYTYRIRFDEWDISPHRPGRRNGTASSRYIPSRILNLVPELVRLLYMNFDSLN